MKDTQRVDFGVLQSHPNKIGRRLIKSLYKWDLNRIQEVTANNHITSLHTLNELFHKLNYGDLEGLTPNPFKGIVRQEKKIKACQKSFEERIRLEVGKKIGNLKYELPESLVINEVELWIKKWWKKRQNKLNTAVKHEKMRLVTLILANTGLSFVDLGKKDIFKIHRSITGPVLSSRRVKTDHIYTIPVTPS